MFSVNKWFHLGIYRSNLGFYGFPICSFPFVIDSFHWDSRSWGSLDVSRGTSYTKSVPSHVPCFLVILGLKWPKHVPKFQGRVISEKKRPLPGSLHTVVRIWVRNHQNTSQSSRDMLFLKKKGPCQEACTPSSAIFSTIPAIFSVSFVFFFANFLIFRTIIRYFQGHSAIFRDVSFLKKRPLPGGLHTVVRIWVKNRFFQNVEIWFNDLSQIEATSSWHLLHPLFNQFPTFFENSKMPKNMAHDYSGKCTPRVIVSFHWDSRSGVLGCSKKQLLYFRKRFCRPMPGGQEADRLTYRGWMTVVQEAEMLPPVWEPVAACAIKPINFNKEQNHPKV